MSQFAMRMTGGNLDSQQPIPSPSLIPQRFPLIIILSAPAIPRHEIQRTRPPKHSASRPRQLPPVDSRLLGRLKLPIIARAQVLAKATWDVDYRIVECGWPSLQDADPEIWGFGKASRDYKACGAAADDNEVEFLSRKVGGGDGGHCGHVGGGFGGIWAEQLGSREHGIGNWGMQDRWRCENKISNCRSATADQQLQAILCYAEINFSFFATMVLATSYKYISRIREACERGGIPTWLCTTQRA
jgi:hypothetical protein